VPFPRDSSVFHWFASASVSHLKSHLLPPDHQSETHAAIGPSRLCIGTPQGTVGTAQVVLVRAALEAWASALAAQHRRSTCSAGSAALFQPHPPSQKATEGHHRPKECWGTAGRAAVAAAAAAGLGSTSQSFR
jgi:hypothetical protein